MLNHAGTPGGGGGGGVSAKPHFNIVNPAQVSTERVKYAELAAACCQTYNDSHWQLHVCTFRRQGVKTTSGAVSLMYMSRRLCCPSTWRIQRAACSPASPSAAIRQHT